MRRAAYQPCRGERKGNVRPLPSPRRPHGQRVLPPYGAPEGGAPALSADAPFLSGLKFDVPWTFCYEWFEGIAYGRAAATQTHERGRIHGAAERRQPARAGTRRAAGYAPVT